MFCVKTFFEYQTVTLNAAAGFVVLSAFKLIFAIILRFQFLDCNDDMIIMINVLIFNDDDKNYCND